MAWQSSTINPATTTPAADISKITNDLQQLRGVIGGTPDVAIPSVWTTPANVLAQTANSATTAGTSTAYTLAPAQAITSYAAGQTFWVTFHAASGANPTLQVSGVASPPTLVRQAASGSYVNIGAGDIPANHRSRVTLLSTSQAFVEEMPPRIASGLKNKIINGKMDIAQRGTSFAAASAYTLDRWELTNTSSAVATVTQQADAPSNNEFRYSYRYAVTTADTSIAAGDALAIQQRIEGFNARDLIGKTFTVSFWVRSSKTGTHCVAFRNIGTNRSYVVEYTISATNTWEQKSISLPSGLITAGTWDWTNGTGLIASWALAAGTTFQTTAGAWQTGNFLATSNQVNCLDTVGNIFAITGVQLEVGSFATEFDHRPFSAELAMCQRYYEQSYEPGAVGTATSVGALQNYNASGATNTAALQVIFKVQKRATPTVTSYSTQSGASGQIRDGSGADRTATVQYVSTSGAHITNSAAGNAANYSAQWVAAIEL
jgi:hypothetical protein